MNAINCDAVINSIEYYDQTRKFNIFFTIFIIFIGLIGNSLAVFVFVQKKFRLHSSSIYLLSLCFSDGLFLLMHFFEDTLRTYIDVYLNDQTRSVGVECLGHRKIYLTNKTVNDSLLRIINITDRFEISCRLVNYLRYFLRFISAYIIVAFSIQRAIAIYLPFYESKFESNKNAWFIVSMIVLIGLIINIWVPFLFTPIVDSYDSSVTYCDIKKEFSKAYFYLTVFYVFLTMLLPIVVIFVCNTIIMMYVLQARKKREGLTNSNFTKSKKCKTKFQNQHLIARVGSNKKFNLSLIKSQSLKCLISIKESNRITRMLILMSFSFAFLNLPYFISWSLFFYQMAIRQNYDFIVKYQLFSAINISEIFYVLNYGVHFFIYCASGKKFRNQLKSALFKN